MSNFNVLKIVEIINQNEIIVNIIEPFVIDAAHRNRLNNFVLTRPVEPSFM